MHSFLQLLLFLVVDLLCVLNLLVLIAKFLEFLLCKLQLVTVTVYLVLALFNLALNFIPSCFNCTDFRLLAVNLPSYLVHLHA